VAVARDIDPELIRAYGAHLNGFCALEIRAATGAPVVVSLHSLPGDPANPVSTVRERIEDRATRGLQRYVLRRADLVLAVYKALLPYLEAIGCRRVALAYNVLNGRSLRPKDDYALHDPIRVRSVGRHIPGKDPRDLIRAVAERPRIVLDLVGTGPLSADARGLINELGVGDRVTLRSAVPNDALVADLADIDVFAAHNAYSGVPKAVLEAMLAGVPLLMAPAADPAVPELDDTVCVFVDDSPDGFLAGLDLLVSDRRLRERIGHNARRWAEQTVRPQRAEEHVVRLYDEVLSRRVCE
jgi:glycosyltransferase involved in cell wall biosynthesis